VADAIFGADAPPTIWKKHQFGKNINHYLVAVPKCIRSENSEALRRQGASSESAAGVLESTLRTISGSATQPGKMHPDLQQKAILGRQLFNNFWFLHY
jgi:hypothetical protein